MHVKMLIFKQSKHVVAQNVHVPELDVRVLTFAATDRRTCVWKLPVSSFPFQRMFCFVLFYLNQDEMKTRLKIGSCFFHASCIPCLFVRLFHVVFSLL